MRSIKDIRKRISRAAYQLEYRRLMVAYIVVPYLWRRQLGMHDLGHLVLPMRPVPPPWTFLGVLGPPRVVASNGDWILIDTGGDDMDDPKTRLDKLPMAVTDALDGLIRAELATANPGRFARVAAVAELSQRLAALYHVRVEDISEEAMVNAELQPYPLPGAYQGGLIRRPGMAPDVRAMMNQLHPEPQRPEDIVRDALSTALPLLRSMNLNNLLALRPQAEALGLDPTRLAAEIHTATENLRAPVPQVVAPIDALGAARQAIVGLNGVEIAAARREATELEL